MADITMCSGEGCPLRGECYRHLATPSEYRQSWFAGVPWNGKLCGHFMPAQIDLDRQPSTTILRGEP